ncbi:unnamed protein product [Notodromas monacha]|uniref:Leucine-rich melanocyte differentiation-associated protein n=1 Tax=Notodromas monacha TaxID=399045 RepID=A0A7R9BC47_9CRUS|nr:unnamed protein product [Notodromas monacha]CAG0912489.1 unnamed protein product [Notodromas monacha]
MVVKLSPDEPVDPKPSAQLFVVTRKNLRTGRVRLEISDLERLVGILKERVPNLKYLSLLGNSACTHQMNHPEFDESDYQRYRYFILHHLPKLKFLDSRAVINDEREQASKIGHLTRVVKPVMKPVAASSSGNSYTPLPEHSLPTGSHAGQPAVEACGFLWLRRFFPCLLI